MTPPPPSIAVVRSESQARSLLDPLRREILERLVEPGSASTVAERLGLPRQRVNYHVRTLEDEGLLHHLEDRRKGNCVERVVQATARRYVVDPRVLEDLGLASIAESPRRLSYSTEDLAASACRTLSEVAELLSEDPEIAERLPTLAIETHVRFRSPDEEIAFASALSEALEKLKKRFHDTSGAAGRTFRIAVGGHLDPASR